jgi:hypothetical protein
MTAAKAASTRESLEDREQRIALARWAQAELRRPPELREARNLLKEFESRRLLSRAEVKELVRRDYGYACTSLYLNLTPENVEGRPRTYLTNFRSMRDAELAARQDLLDRLSREQFLQLRADLVEIEELLEIMDAGHARSLVVFKAGPELSRVSYLPVRTVDSFSIDIDPYIAPAEAVLERYPSLLVVEVHKEKSRFAAYHLGRLEEIDRVKSFVPTDQVDKGRPGKVQRHRQSHLTWHLKAIAQQATRLVDDEAFDVVVLAGAADVVAGLEPYLPDRVRDRVAYRLDPSPEWSEREWLDALERVVKNHRRAAEEQAAARLGDALGSGLVRRGLADVIEVMVDFLARHLYLSDQLREPAFACRTHHFLSLEDGTCPFCGAPLMPVDNIADELIELALLHGVELTLFEERPELMEPYDGVAALAYLPD